MNGKNILVLSPTPSHPQDAGNRKRIYALTKYLQELGATVYFVYCPREWDREIPQNSYGGMNQCWDYFFVSYPVQRAVHRTDDEYFEIDAWWDVGIEFTVNWIKLSVDIDMVLCNYVFYSKVLELFDENVMKVIDTHDIVSNRNYLLEKKLGYRDFFFTSPESEQKALNRAHLILSIKEDESSWFKCLSPTPVLTIGHLEPQPTDIKPKEIEYSNIKLGFIGSANPINRKNLESFLNRYLAIYGQYAEQFTFVVGGKICNVLDKKFHDDVQILGMVDDVSEFYEKVDVVVLPFEFSTGLKIKTVEALSWDKPCIGTVNAFEGLGSSCKYHSFKNIENLVYGIKDLILDPQSVITQLRQDSDLVRTSYANKVKRSIQKLYNVNWQSIKQLQIEPEITTKIEETELEEQKVYNFNLVTNVDFWKSHSNESLWINFWLSNAQKTGNVNVFRTASFTDIANDKQILYRLGLVNNVHHRELDQVIDLFKIAPDNNQIFINLIDFSSIVDSQSCMVDLEQIQLATNHFFWCFFSQLEIKANDLTKEYARKILSNSSIQLRTNYIWDFNSSLVPEVYSQNANVKLINNPIDLDTTSSLKSLNLEQIVIGTSCCDLQNLSELKRLTFCCQNFLPDNFKLVIISDLDLVKNNHSNVYSDNKADELMQKIDLFVCIEDPKTISFLIYLCICRSILISYKNKTFAENLIECKLMKPLISFTYIPEVYRSYLESTALRQSESIQVVRHKNWQLFLEHCLMQTSMLSCLLPKKTQQLANKI